MKEIDKGRYTIRVYQKELVNELETVYKKVMLLYSSKNPFLVDCLFKGIKEIEKELLQTEKTKNQIEFEELQKTFNSFSSSIKKRFDESNILITINQKLLSCLYNLLFAINNQTPIKQESFDKGYHDDLPFRFVELMAEMLNK